jgi:four helix bundle protein
MDEKVQKLEQRLIAFAANIIVLSERLPRTPAGRHFADQVMRSGTSPALHYGEAQGAESKADFIHKMKVALKELKETFVAMRIINMRQWLPPEALPELLRENNELISIFVTSIKTASGNGGSTM